MSDRSLKIHAIGTIVVLMIAILSLAINERVALALLGTAALLYTSFVCRIILET